MSIKISELPQATSVGSSDIVPIVQGGTTKQATAGMMNLDVYSTTEQRVGTWIDGKPLYRKVYQCTAPVVSSNGTWASAEYDLDTNFDYGFVQTAIITDTANQYLTTPFITNGGFILKAYIGVVGYGDNTHRLSIVSNYTGANNRTVYAVVCYTKTTDSAS